MKKTIPCATLGKETEIALGGHVSDRWLADDGRYSHFSFWVGGGLYQYKSTNKWLSLIKMSKT